MTFEVRAVREEEREECLDLWCTVWPGESSRSYFRRYFYGDVDWLPYYTRVGMLDGRMVSAVQICRRVVSCGEYRLTMGGIANVATLPQYRGKGFNTQCLSSAISVMEADAMDFSLLFTGIHGYYGRLGFARLSAQYLEAPLPESPPEPGTLVVRDGTPRDLAAIRSIYDEYNAGRPITVQRSDAYWRDWVKERNYLVAEARTGQVAAYFMISEYGYKDGERSEQGGHVEEFGASARCDAAACLDSLIRAYLSRLQDRGAAQIKLSLPLDETVRRGAQRAGLKPEERPIGGGMARLLHPDNLLRGFLPELNERWAHVGRPEGELSFATPYGAVSLVGRGTRLQVESRSTGAYTQDRLFSLLFQGVVSTGEPAAEFEAALFPAPAKALAYWGADGF